MANVYTAPGEVGGGRAYDGFFKAGWINLSFWIHARPQALGAMPLIEMQLVQNQLQWNQRTSLLATAIQT